jgi:hypothetical protein
MTNQPTRRVKDFKARRRSWVILTSIELPLLLWGCGWGDKEKFRLTASAFARANEAVAGSDIEFNMAFGDLQRSIDVISNDVKRSEAGLCAAKLKNYRAQRALWATDLTLEMYRGKKIAASAAAKDLEKVNRLSKEVIDCSAQLDSFAFQ